MSSARKQAIFLAAMAFFDRTARKSALFLAGTQEAERAPWVQLAQLAENRWLVIASDGALYYTLRTP